MSTPRMLILAVIERWLRTHQYAPSLREIQDVLGYGNVSSVKKHLDLLRSDGLVDWVEGQNRTVHLTLEGVEALKHESGQPS